MTNPHPACMTPAAMCRALAAGAGLWLFALGGAVPADAQQFSNAYTRLNLDRCLSVKRPGEDPPGEAFRCKGFKNAPAHDIYVFEEDGRFFLSYGRDAFERRAAGQTLDPYNTIGDDLEWRLERRAGDWLPFALIARFFTEVTDEAGIYRGEVLVIFRIGPEEACHAVYIDARATENANRFAREAADSLVRRFDCATDKPVIYGKPGRSLGPTS